MWWIPRIAPPWSDAIDIALVALLVYGALVTARGARAHLALLGMAMLAVIYLLAQQMGLLLTATVFQAFTAVFLILMTIIFQQELRQAFERIAVFGLGRSGSARRGENVDEILVSTLSRLAESRIGALLVLPGHDPIERHVRGGIPLAGRVSEPLLHSIFDPHSPGHDGAVVIEGDRVLRFAVHLPLSASVAQLRNRGTRHAAALGLSECTDALCLVVSEERGQVSAAHRGQLIQLRSPAAISERLRQFAEIQDPHAALDTGSALRALRALRGNWREGGISVGLALLLWVLLIPGSELVERAYSVPVQITNLPEEFVLESVDPPRVEAVFSAPRREFFFLDPSAIEVRVDALLVQLGRRTFQLSEQSVEHPPELRVMRVAPNQLRISVRRETPGAGSGPGSAGSE
jgi:diadenylate cyclase